MYQYIKEQLIKVREEIALTAEQAGREPDSVKLLAVSKTFPAEAVVAAYEAGQRLFGENRVQELNSKAPELPDDIQWHLIGHLQNNKVSNALEYASMIHSVDSKKLLDRINRIAGEKKLTVNLLFEVNISGENSKFGMADRMAEELAEYSFTLDNVQVKGLMTMAPFGAEEYELRNIFSSLRILKEKIENNNAVTLPELSMGMSSDFREAVKEGATLVRIGTAIFGKR
jgi:pyridoxal phosphate enzyme (YggS family)